MSVLMTLQRKSAAANFKGLSSSVTLLLAIGFALTTTGCSLFRSNLANLQVWADDEMAVVAPNAQDSLESDVFSPADTRIRLQGAVDETVSFQILLRCDEPVTVQRIIAEPIQQGEQVIPATALRMFHEVYVPTVDYPAWYLRLTPNLRSPREIPDPLIPLTAPHALPIDLQANRTEAIWCDLHIPTGTESGLYRSTVQIVVQGGFDRQLSIVLEVWPFALPQTRHLTALSALQLRPLLRQHLRVAGRPYAPAHLSFEDPAYPQAAALIDRSLKLLHEHRCAAVLEDLRPARQVGTDGQLTLDWTDYDRLVGGAIDGTLFEDRIPPPYWPLPISSSDPLPDAYGGLDAVTYQQMLETYLRQCVQHFQEKGWFERHYIEMTPPATDRAQAYTQFERIGRLVQQTDSRLRLLCSLTPQSMAPYGWLNDPFKDVSSFVHFWCPPASLTDRHELQQQQAAGRRAWLWSDRTPFAGSLSLLASSVDARSLAWQAYRWGCDLIRLPGVNNWMDDGIPSVFGSEQALLWPGQPYGLDGPVPSIRLKRLLRGLQDVEYLWLLTQHGRPSIAQTIAADLVPGGGTDSYGDHFLDGRPGGWASDPQSWQLARRLMGRELLLVMQSDETRGATVPPADSSDFAERIEWARLAQAVRQVRLQVQGVSLRATNDVAKPLQAAAVVDIFNGTHEPLTGSLVAQELPPEVAGEPAEIKKLAPGARTRRTVRIALPSVPENPNGCTTVQFAAIADGESKPAATATGRLAVLTSTRIQQPLRIDGTLDDWPGGITNVAGDFVLVGADEIPKTDRPQGTQPSQPTQVFVCHDAVNFYVAFNCYDAHLNERTIRRDNVVQYDELWPSGEDLVEVVIDPHGHATTAGDLLHITVKANGSVITERGVPCLTQVAALAVWPAMIQAAVDDRTFTDRWTVEMSIPLSSLDKPAPLFGINFGRYQHRLGEYSSWSAAPRYLYSPWTLGNIRLGS